MSHPPTTLSPELLQVVTEWELSRRSLIVEAALVSIDHILHAHRQEELAVVERDVSRSIHEGYQRRREEARMAATTTPSPTRPPEAHDDNDNHDEDESPKTARGPAPTTIYVPTANVDQSSIPTLTFKWNLPTHNSRVKEPVLSTDDPATTRANKQECYRDHTSPPAITSPRRSYAPVHTSPSSPNRGHDDVNIDTSVREESRSVSQVAAVADVSTTSLPTNQSFDHQPISWGSPTPSSSAVAAPAVVGPASGMRWAGGESSTTRGSTVATGVTDSPVEEVFTTSWAGTPSRTAAAGSAIPLRSALEDDLSAKKVASPPTSHSRRRTGPVRCESPNVRMLRALKEKLASSSASSRQQPEQHQQPVEDEPEEVEEAAPTPSRQLNPSIIYNVTSPQSYAESILQLAEGLDESCDSTMYAQSDTSCTEAVQRSVQAASVPRRGRLFEGITHSVPSPSHSHTFRDPNSDDRTLLHTTTTTTTTAETGNAPTPAPSSRSMHGAVATTPGRSSPFRGLPMGRRGGDANPEPTAAATPVNSHTSAQHYTSNSDSQPTNYKHSDSQPTSNVSLSEPTSPPPSKVAVTYHTTSPDPPSNPPTAPTAATVTSLYDYETLRDISVQLEEIGGGECSSTVGGGDGPYSRTESKVDDGTSTCGDDDDFAAADAALEAMRSVLASGRQASSSSSQPVVAATATTRIVRGDMSGGRGGTNIGKVAPQPLPVRDNEYIIEESPTTPEVSPSRTSISVALREEIAAALASQPAPLVPEARTADAQFVQRLQTPPVVAPLTTATLKMPTPAPSPIDSSPPRHVILTREVPPNPSRPPPVVSTPPPSPPSNLPVVLNRSIDEVYEASASPTPTPTLVPTPAPSGRSYVTNIKQATAAAEANHLEISSDDGDKKIQQEMVDEGDASSMDHQEVIERDEEEDGESTESGVEQPRSPPTTVVQNPHHVANPTATNAKGYSSMFMATPAAPQAVVQDITQQPLPHQHIPSLVSSCASSVAGVESAAGEEDRYNAHEEEALESEVATPRSATVERAVSNTNTRSQSVPPEENEDDFTHRAVSLPPDVAQAVEEDKEYYEYYVVDDSSAEGGCGSGTTYPTAYTSQAASHRGSSIPVAEDADIFDADLDASLSGSGPRSRRRTKANTVASDDVDSRSANSSPVKQLITHAHPAAVVATPPPTVCDVLDFDSPIPTAQPTTVVDPPSTASSRFLANLSTETDDAATKASSPSSPSGRYRHRRTKVNNQK